MVNSNKLNKQMQPSAEQPSPAVDHREQLYNGKETGPVTTVSLPEIMITSLHSILLDVDPMSFHKDKGAGIRKNPEKFYEKVVKPMLGRNSVLARAEVRVSGTGLHVIVRLAESIEFKTAGDRQRWAGIVRAVQRLLPTDPNAPGITALTRPVGSINSKNKKPIVSLAEGQPVSPAEVVALVNELCAKPFATVASVLFGKTPVTPCPVCCKAGSSLGVMDRFGHCYAGGCGKVKLEQLYDHFLKPVLPAEEK